MNNVYFYRTTQLKYPKKYCTLYVEILTFDLVKPPKLSVIQGSTYAPIHRAFRFP